MEGLCLVGAFLIFFFAWIYEKVADGNKENTYSCLTSSAAYSSSNATKSRMMFSKKKLRTSLPLPTDQKKGFTKDV
jgi:hypothetical protein